MEIEYELTTDDYLHFSEYHCQHSPTIRRTKLFTFLMGPVAFGIMGLVEYVFRDRLSALIAFWTAGLLYLAIMPLYWKWSIRRRTLRLLAEGPNAGRTTPCTLKIDEGGIHVTSPKGEANLNWIAIEKVRCTEKYLYLYTGAMSAIVVPSRAFASTVEFDRFVTHARELREAAAGLPATIEITHRSLGMDKSFPSEDDRI